MYLTIKYVGFVTACTILAQINMGLEHDNPIFTIDCLQSARLNLSEKHKIQCFEALKRLKKIKVIFIQSIFSVARDMNINFTNLTYSKKSIPVRTLGT